MPELLLRDLIIGINANIHQLAEDVICLGSEQYLQIAEEGNGTQ